jgi:stage II sporulation protein D
LRKRLNACAKTLNLPELANIRSIRAIEPVSTNVHGRPTELAIYGRGSESCVVRTKDFVRAVNAPVKHLPLISERARSSFLIGQKHGSTLQIDGHGMGHGVGLCQYGAQALAGKGESWQNILSWYYPQVTICT